MRIFQSSNNNDLVEISEATNGNFGLEKEIQNLVENNLDSIFPDLEFVATEPTLDDLRPDTIAFDKDKTSFAIIEYKNIKNNALIDQGVSYYQLLQNNKADFVLLYNQKKNQTFAVSDINWDETRIIFISPQYTKYQKSASSFQGLPIKLYEIKKYQKNIITLNLIEDSSKKQKAFSSKENKKPKTNSIFVKYDEDEYLNHTISSDTKRLWHALKDRIEETFDDVEFQQKKYYAGYYLKDKGSSVCTLEAFKEKIKLIYSTTDANLIEISDFVEDVSKTGTRGSGHYRSPIKSTEDIEKAIPHIRKVYQSKKEKKSQMR